MKIPRSLILFALLFPAYAGTMGQEPVASAGSLPESFRYPTQPDQELINGVQYSDKHPLSSGNPYLLGGEFREGSLQVRSRTYSGVLLRYNIHTQTIELAYETPGGGRNQIVLVSDRITGFTLGALSFQRMEIRPGETAFLQEIASGDRLFCIRWEKNLGPVSGDSRILEAYSDARRQYYVLEKGELRAFDNRRTFLGLYPEEVRKALKRTLSRMHFNFRTASPDQIARLMRNLETGTTP